MTGEPCTIDGCEKPQVARGWCQMHYIRWRIHGDVTRVDPPGHPPTPVKPCATEGCTRPTKGQDLCIMHYNRAKRARGTLPLMELLKRSDPCVAEGCDRRGVCRGLCDKHYRYFMKRGRLGEFPLSGHLRVPK